MKVLLVSHTCMSRTAGQPKAHCLAAFPNVELTVLVPDRMRTYGQWQSAETPEAPDFRYIAGRTRWRSVLNQWHLQHYADALPGLLREVQPDIVDIWEEPWGLSCAQAVWLTRRLCPQAKIIVETEQNIFKRLPPPFRQFQDYSLRRADFVVARSREALAVARRKGYVGPADVVPNAVDCALFRPLPAAPHPAGEFVIGYVGRLVPEKGLADAVAALALLPDRARLVLVGDGPFRPALEELSRRAKVESRVRFAGSVPLSDLPAHMNAMDALVLPSHTTATWKEQFGRVLIEAGACGLPVVGSDSGAIPEVIGGAGLTFPEGDPAALADRLRTLLDHPERRAEYGRVGQERARGLYSWQRVAEQMHTIYEHLVSEHLVSEHLVSEDPAGQQSAYQQSAAPGEGGLR